MWKTGKIKYGKEFLDMLERELMTSKQYREKEAKEDAERRERLGCDPITLARGWLPEDSFSSPRLPDRMYSIEGRTYGVDFSSLLPTRDSSEHYIGKHSDIDFFEMKGEEELEKIVNENGLKIPKSRILRALALRKFSKFRHPDLYLGMEIMDDLQKISHELYKPKRIAEFVGVYSDDDNNELIMVPKRETHTRLVMRASGGASVCELDFPKNELEKYPVVDFLIKLEDNPWAAY